MNSDEIDRGEDLSKPDNKLSTLRRHDLVVAAIIWCVSLATLIESWRLTFHLNLPGVEAEKAWLVAPGIFPLVLSVCLLLMFSVVIWVSLKEGEFNGHFSRNKALLFLQDSENIRQIVQISLLCLYVFVLLGRLHFGVASALYMFAAMFTAHATKWYVALIIAIVFAAAVTFVFGSVMKIPLP